MRTKFTKIHMIGIGGSGMSGIAEVLLNLGYEVHGSDMADGPVVQRLRSLGADIHIGHAAGNVDDVNVLVKSSAVAEDNPEVVAARQKGIPVIPRAEMLAELMRLRTGIAIAGTHGKTSTTSLTAAIFDAASLDPTVIIGGRINAYGANARLGQGEYLIAEADESDGSFLCLLPIINVVTNVDRDHLDHYGNQEAIDEAFVSFMNQIPFYGLNVVCGDDPGVERLLPRVKRPVVTYGFGSGNHIRAEVLECGVINRFKVFIKGEELGEVTLRQPGRHNILNALAPSAWRWMPASSRISASRDWPVSAGWGGVSSTRAKKTTSLSWTTTGTILWKLPRRWRRPVPPTRIAGLWWRFSRTVSRGHRRCSANSVMCSVRWTNCC